MRRSWGWIPGSLLLAAGCAVLGFWAWFLWAPLEEPASLGRTPNPSRMQDREELLAREKRTFKRVYYGGPVVSLLLLGAGAISLVKRG